MKSLLIRTALLLVGVTITATAADPEYKILKTYKVGGEGSWDYLTVDPASRNVFISRGTHVMVVNADNGKVVGDIPNTDGVHGIALVPKFGKGFISDGRAGSVTIFNLKSLKAIATARAGENPDAIIYDPASKRVFAFNGRSHDATAIDAASGNVAGTVPLDGKPEFAQSDSAGKVYVNIEDKSEIQTIDSKALKVTATWPLSPCEEPSGLALDREDHKLFAGCHNKMLAVVDTNSGKVVATPPIGQGVDANAYDEDRHLAFSSNGDGTLTIVKKAGAEKFNVVQNVQTAPRARTMALDPKTHNIYLVTAQFEAPPAGATGEGGRPARPTMLPDSFKLIVVGTGK
jgi:hypothetical protein